MDRILIVETNEAISTALKARMLERNTSVVECTLSEEALFRVREGVQAVLLSQTAAGTGLDLLRDIKAAAPALPVVVLAASAEDALRALQLGASYAPRKPVHIDEIALLVDRVMHEANVARDVHRPGVVGTPVIIGETPAIKGIRETVERLAASQSTTLLLTGESGSGKDTIAQALHAATSPDRPMVYLSPSTLGEPLLEIELFGSEEDGSGRPSKIGLVQQAAGGTLFIDELSDMPASLHHKFLRYLEDKTYRPVGSIVERRCDLRVMASTRSGLHELFSQGPTRAELLYRLAVVVVEVPPLRARRADIPLLAAHFLENAARRLGREAPRISPEAMRLLDAHSFPGNVRELKNVIERAVLVGANDIIEAAHIEFPTRTRSVTGTYRLPPEGIDFRSLEKDVLGQALCLAGGNQRRAAKLLGMTRDQIRYRMAKFELTSARPTDDARVA